MLRVSPYLLPSQIFRPAGYAGHVHSAALSTLPIRAKYFLISRASRRIARDRGRLFRVPSVFFHGNDPLRASSGSAFGQRLLALRDLESFGGEVASAVEGEQRRGYRRAGRMPGAAAAFDLNPAHTAPVSS